MSTTVHTYTSEELERRRYELHQLIDSAEFQERIAQGALLDREEDMLAELEDLDYLAAHASPTA